MNSKRKIEINIVEFQTYKILIKINSNRVYISLNIMKIIERGFLNGFLLSPFGR